MLRRQTRQNRPKTLLAGSPRETSRTFVPKSTGETRKPNHSTRPKTRKEPTKNPLGAATPKRAGSSWPELGHPKRGQHQLHCAVLTYQSRGFRYGGGGGDWCLQLPVDTSHTWTLRRQQQKGAFFQKRQNLLPIWEVQVWITNPHMRKAAPRAPSIRRTLDAWR